MVTAAEVETTGPAGRKTHLTLTMGIANNYGSSSEVLADIKLTGYKATVTANYWQVQAVFNLGEVDNERLKTL